MTTKAHPDIWSDLDGLSYQELLTLKEENLQRLADCKQQESDAIELRIKTGQRADPEWWTKLMGAIKVGGLRDQAIARRLRPAKRKEFDEQVAARRQEKAERPRQEGPLQALRSAKMTLIDVRDLIGNELGWECDEDCPESCTVHPLLIQVEMVMGELDKAYDAAKAPVQQ